MLDTRYVEPSVLDNEHVEGICEIIGMGKAYVLDGRHMLDKMITWKASAR